MAARQEKLKALREKRVLQDPLAFLQDKRLLLDYTQQKLVSSTKEQLAVQRHRFGRLAASLDALSPLKVLGRGYAMVQNESGQVVKTSEQVSPGDGLRVRLGQGTLRCTVREKE